MNTTNKMWYNFVFIIKHAIVAVTLIYGAATIIFILSSCSSTMPSHKIMDRDKYVHDYKERLDACCNFSLNEKIQMYCKSHKRWETVTMISTKYGIEFIVR